MANVRVLCVALAGAALATVVPAAADPITITSGTVSVGGFARGAFRSIDFSLSGDSLAISGTDPDGPSQSTVPPCSQFSPCTAGMTSNASDSYSANGAFGSATLNGTRHPDVLFDGASFSFSSGNFILPATTADRFDVRTPFVFQGMAIFRSVSGSDYNTSYGGYSLTGRGTATAHLERFQNGYALSGFTYEFENAGGSPTPEPASMLLLGAGLAAAWQSRRLGRADR